MKMIDVINKVSDVYKEDLYMFGEGWDDEIDEEWENFRAEANAFMKNKEESVIKKWLNEIGYTEPVGYYRNVCTREMEIYAKRVGCLIGKAGINVKQFEKMLNEEVGGDWKVKFIEVRGGFVNV